MESSERPTFVEIKEYLEGLIENKMSSTYYLALPMDLLLEGQLKILFMVHDQISTMKDVFFSCMAHIVLYGQYPSKYCDI